MKVKCIVERFEAVDKWERFIERLFGRTKPEPQYDYIYTVVEKIAGYYTLEEFEGEGWRVECFVPVDGVGNQEQEKMQEVTFTEIKKNIPTPTNN